jgi:flagellar motor switch protein FliN
MANSNIANPGAGGAGQNPGHGASTGPNAKSIAGPAAPDKTERSANKSPHEFATPKKNPNSAMDGNLDFILDIPLEITVELGRTKMLINDLLKLGQGSVIELAKPAGDTLEILANQRLIAKGDVVVINDKYGIRLTEVVSPVERVERLG